jgi:hypothetical protein
MNSIVAGCILLIPLLASANLEDDLQNPGSLRGLSEAERSALEERGFVVRPGPFEDFYELYTDLAEKNEPLLLTPDALLHTYHVLFDYALRTVEKDHFLRDLESLTDLLLCYEISQHRASPTGPIREDHRRNTAYFAVAKELLSGDSEPPPEVAELVEAELDLIRAHEGLSVSPIFGYREDYSQYVPRGHYTRNEDFERYFLAMMWYGRMSFSLRPEVLDPEADPDGPLRRALLICRALRDLRLGDASALEVWERIYEPTVFFVGASDDFTVHQILKAADEVLEGEPFDILLRDSLHLEAFRERIGELGGPRIVSQEVWPWEVEAATSFRFMGQRFIPDSYMFQELVFDRVGTLDVPRLFPRGLDVMAVLGSKRARDLLVDYYHEDTLKNYVAQLDGLIRAFDALSERDWEQNLYYSWLYALKLLLIPPEGGDLPLFVRSTAWPDKCLTSALGSWAELRHDTILYAKQSYTLLGMAAPVEPPLREVPPSYVEPYPEVFRFLARLAKRTLDDLGDRDLLHPEIAVSLKTLHDLSERCAKIAQKEISGSLPETEDCEFAQVFGERLEESLAFSFDFEQEYLSETDERMPVVADVHTDPNTLRVLQVGVGEPLTIYAIVPSEDGPVLARGAMFSYYEFKVPMDERMTDEDWQELVPKPPMEGWTESFIVR